MTEPISPGAAPSRPRRNRVVALSIAGAVIIGAGGFLAGRASVNVNPQPLDCPGIRESSAAALADAQPSSAPTHSVAPPPDRIKLREAVHLALQNPACYSAQERAQAQVLLDQLNSTD